MSIKAIDSILFVLNNAEEFVDSCIKQTSQGELGNKVASERYDYIDRL